MKKSVDGRFCWVVYRGDEWHAESRRQSRYVHNTLDIVLSVMAALYLLEVRNLFACLHLSHPSQPATPAHLRPPPFACQL